MARQQYFLITALLALGASANLGRSAEPEQEKDQDHGHPNRKADRKVSPEFENVRKALDALTPEQLKRFQENFSRWSDLAPERKRELRDRDESRRKRIAEAVDTAIKESALQLTSEQRDLFAKRYAEERRKIEEDLRQEVFQKRKPLLGEMVTRLVAEFSTATTPTPASTGKP